MAHKLRTLIYDIETAPNTVRQWRPTQRWTPHHQIVKYGHMLTWAAKWWGEKTVFSRRLTKPQILAGDDRDLTESLASMIREADVIVAHYGDKFDKPYVNSRLAFHRLPNLAHPRTIDTKKLAARDMLLPHNNLDGIAQYAGIKTRKISVDHSLWDRVLDGPDHIAAIKEMEEYNRQDVIVLEKVFEWELPYVDRVARLFGASARDEQACDKCGSELYEYRGWYRTQSGDFPKVHCLNAKCGAYRRGRKSNYHRFAGHPL